MEQITNCTEATLVQAKPTIPYQNLYTATELIKMGVDKIPTLIDPILPKYGLAALIGTSDIGKSNFLLQLCKDVCMSEEFLGLSLQTEHKSAIYVSTEDDKYSLSYRLRHLKGTSEEVTDRLRFIFNSDDLLEKLDKELSKNPADLVVIDTFSDIFPGEMNQVNKVRYFMSDFYNLADSYNCAIIFNHHIGKNKEEQPPSKNNSIGSTGFEGKARLVIELRQDYSIPDRRHMCIVKGNYLSAAMKSESYELDFDIDKGFTPTGSRKSFDELAKPKFINRASRDSERALVLNFHKQGKSVREIEGIMKGRGYKVSKSTVSEWINSVRPDDSPKE